MGTSPHLGVSGVHCTMRAVVIVLLGAVAINAEAEADPLQYLSSDIYHGVNHGAGVYNAFMSTVNHDAGVHPVHHTATPNYLWFAKREAEAEAEADPMMYHHTGVAHVGGVHPVHTAVYNHHVVPAVHHGVNHVAGVYNAPVSTVNHVAGVHHVGVGHVAGVHPVHNVVRGVYNTYPYLG